MARKQPLIDAIEPPPAPGLSENAAHIVRLRRAELGKLSADQLRGILARAESAAARETVVMPIVDREYIRLVDAAESAGPLWRSALQRAADAGGVSMPPLTTLRETCGILANKLARKITGIA